jgi:hypothetical protein
MKCPACQKETTLEVLYYNQELALLTDKPRKATIIAKGKLKLACLGKKAFVRLLGPVVNIIKRNAANYETIYQKIELID